MTLAEVAATATSSNRGVFMFKKILAGLGALFVVAIVATPAPAPAAGICAVLYSGEKFSGNMFTVPDGADISYVGNTWNDEISSMRVSPRCRLRVWDHAGKRGSHLTYSTGGRSREVSWMGMLWDDRVSSLSCTCR
jgi:hypothetical protein